MNTKNTTLRENIEEKLHEQEQLEHRKQKLANRAEYLAGKERRDRTHRLVTRGAALESIIPEAKQMSERDFYLALEAFFSDETVRSAFCNELNRQTKVSEKAGG